MKYRHSPQKKTNPFNVIIDWGIINGLRKRELEKEPVHLLIGVKQIDERGSSYRVYDIVEHKDLEKAGLVGRGEVAVAEGFGIGERLSKKMLSGIEKRLEKAKISEATELGIVHHHRKRIKPTMNDVILIRKYPYVLHLIYVEEADEIYAYNGSCDLLSVMDDTLKPREASLEIFYQTLPSSVDVWKLKEKIKKCLEKRRFF
jgi:hypothetical protein